MEKKISIPLFEFSFMYEVRLLFGVYNSALIGCLWTWRLKILAYGTRAYGLALIIPVSAVVVVKVDTVVVGVSEFVVVHTNATSNPDPSRIVIKRDQIVGWNPLF